MEDLNITGLELMELCGDDDAGEIQNKLLNFNSRYEQLKNQAREKSKELCDARAKKTQEVGDSLDNLLDDLATLNRNLTTAEPVPAGPDKLKDEIRENKVLTIYCLTNIRKRRQIVNLRFWRNIHIVLLFY